MKTTAVQSSLRFGSISGATKKQIAPPLYAYLAQRAEKFVVSVDPKGNVAIKGTGHPITLNADTARNGNAAVSAVRRHLDGKR